MIIQHNMLATFTNRQLGINSKNTSKSAERLSSGYKINRAADNAAGLTISEKLRSQIRGLDRSQMNIQDGASYCNVADGALNEVHSMLDRVKELSVQAANDTNVDSDREMIDKEVQQIKNEITSVLSDTNFNTIKIWQAAYVPETAGECQDFSLYNIQDGTQSYYGGIIYMNHRYSWEDLGIGWDSATHTFTDTDSYEINSGILHNNGTVNDPDSTKDDYTSSGGALFYIQTQKDSGAVNVEKSYSWSANNTGIYIDGVLTDGTPPEAGNTTWAAMGLTPGQEIPGGTYQFNYYGMDVSFEVPAEGSSWSDFLGGINNNLISIDWHSRYSVSVSREVADIVDDPITIKIDNTNKDYISTSGYTVHADKDGIWLENGGDAIKPLEKSDPDDGSTLMPWETIENDEGDKIMSWGLNEGGSGASDTNHYDTANPGAPSADGQGDTHVTLNSDSKYTFKNSQLGETDFTFKFGLLDEASLGAVIKDIDYTIYQNVTIESPTAVSCTPPSSEFSVTGSSSVSFLTQRNKLNREFENGNEEIAAGKIDKDGGNYKLTLEEAGGGKYEMSGDSNIPAVIDQISDAIQVKMKALYDAKLAANPTDPSVIADLSEGAEYTKLDLGIYTINFEQDGNTVSLQLDLRNVKYGDIISEAEYTDSGWTPERAGFEDKVKSYIENNIGNIDLKLNGNGETYQYLGLTENHVSEEVAVNKPIVEGFTLSLNIQSGANAGDTIGINYEYLRPGTLGIKGTNVLTREAAAQAIGDVDFAIEKVSGQRAVFGSYMNRLQYAYEVNGISSENMQRSESSIRDADMANEMVEYWKHNVLAQAGQTLLAQANQSANGVLTLLR